ncbi:tRNA uridine(34) 5-carboxymethylaminomethyl modification radical SAM/GNAT enzyme Elp3 [Candidatus Woesearchaeota archaeon]|nr:tRNA uridine(34) 5-carboxymethylaminomethyl modification radical SAM/GNAT enzyme Elp3 [Candidatus Woesearchaeota archaeon]
MKKLYDALIEEILTHKYTKEQLMKRKVVLCGQHKAKEIPTDIALLLHAKPSQVKKLEKYLASKPVRTGSGVTVVAIMTKPWKCPHGTCTMCPGGKGSFFGDVPQSYTGNEPATMRGMRNLWDPYLQIFNRLEQYVVLGQSPEKVELIIMGGTFIAMPARYKEDYILNTYKAMNDFSKEFYTKQGDFRILKFRKFFELPGDIHDKQRRTSLHKKMLELKQKGHDKTNIEKEKRRNETSNIKCVGLTIETRPDWGLKEHGIEMLRYGTTRIELGIQSVYDDALHRIKRGHGLAENIKSIQELKDLGFKLNYHMMPGIPGMSKKQDLQGLKELFNNPDFRPDMLKIYPLMVMPGTELEKDYHAGKFKPITTEDAAEIICEMKKDVPKYCRIMRVQRDIPTKVTVDGVKLTNFRQYIDQLMQKKKYSCQCIRCREIRGKEIKEVKEETIEYDSSGGKEYFISLVSEDNIIGFLRLRFPGQQLIKNITPTTAIIRELHVYGQAKNIGDKALKNDVQHKGFGRLLIEKAEQIARQNGKDKMIVISGVGVREYYYKLGYKLEEPYVVKTL